eukprot:3705319-Amphidinium_carterae.1
MLKLFSVNHVLLMCWRFTPSHVATILDVRPGTGACVCVCCITCALVLEAHLLFQFARLTIHILISGIKHECHKAGTNSSSPVMIREGFSKPWI